MIKPASRWVVISAGGMPGRETNVSARLANVGLGAQRQVTGLPFSSVATVLDSHPVPGVRAGEMERVDAPRHESQLRQGRAVC